MVELENLKVALAMFFEEVVCASVGDIDMVAWRVGGDFASPFGTGGGDGEARSGVNEGRLVMGKWR